MSHGIAYSPSCLTDDFALRKLNDNIKRSFNIKLIDRNRIIPQVKVLLKETGEYWLQKIDLKKFFESIDHKVVVKELCEDARLSYESKRILEKLFSCDQALTWQGVPRGISLSSTLSEYYMQRFDNWCRMLDNCYFYTRYVDDILLLFHEDPQDILAELDKSLPSGVTLNRDKCVSLHRPRQGKVTSSDGANGVTYLGYDFSFQPGPEKKPSELLVGIAQKKIKKIKTRIALSLFEFCKNKDYDLLRNRFKFLASNFKIREDSASGNLYAGVYFNHSLIDSARLKDLYDIDSFLRRSVFSTKGSLGKKLNPLLTIEQKRELCRFSLAHGHQEKIVRPFDSNEFCTIKSVWNHV